MDRYDCDVEEAIPITANVMHVSENTVELLYFGLFERSN